MRGTRLSIANNLTAGLTELRPRRSGPESEFGSLFTDARAGANEINSSLKEAEAKNAWPETIKPRISVTTADPSGAGDAVLQIKPRSTGVALSDEKQAQPKVKSEPLEIPIQHQSRSASEQSRRNRSAVSPAPTIADRQGPLSAADPPNPRNESFPLAYSPTSAPAESFPPKKQPQNNSTVEQSGSTTALEHRVGATAGASQAVGKPVQQFHSTTSDFRAAIEKEEQPSSSELQPTSETKAGTFSKTDPVSVGAEVSGDLGKVPSPERESKSSSSNVPRPQKLQTEARQLPLSSAALPIEASGTSKPNADYGFLPLTPQAHPAKAALMRTAEPAHLISRESTGSPIPTTVLTVRRTGADAPVAAIAGSSEGNAGPPQRDSGSAPRHQVEHELDELPVSSATFLRANARHVDVGVNDPTHGWIEIRAQNSAGHVAAALHPASADLRSQLHAELPALTQYLADRQIKVQTLTVEHGARGTGGGGDRREPPVGESSDQAKHSSSAAKTQVSGSSSEMDPIVLPRPMSIVDLRV